MENMVLCREAVAKHQSEEDWKRRGPIFNRLRPQILAHFKYRSRADGVLAINPNTRKVILTGSDLIWKQYLKGEGLEEGPLGVPPGVGGVDFDVVLRARVEAADVEGRRRSRDVQHHRVVRSTIHLQRMVFSYYLLTWCSEVFS